MAELRKLGIIQDGFERALAPRKVEDLYLAHVLLNKRDGKVVPDPGPSEEAWIAADNANRTPATYLGSRQGL